MVFVPVPNVFRGDWRFRCDGQEMQFSQYWADSLGTPGAVSLIDTIMSEHWDRLRLVFSPDVALVERVITDLSTQSSPSFSFPVTPPQGGANVGAGEALPNNVSLCVSARTSLRGRSFRGRNYLPPLPEQLVDGNTVLTTAVTAILDSYNLMRADSASQALDMVVVSRVSNGVPRAQGLTTDITTFIVSDPTVDSQRRRLPGRGR